MRAIERSSHITIIGYGGADDHINIAVNKYKKKDAKITIITREGDKTEWKKKIPGCEDPIKMKNILDYDFS